MTQKTLIIIYTALCIEVASMAQYINANKMPTADVREVISSLWIPISERLPEENQKCLITTRWGWEYLAEYRAGYFYGESWSFETTDVTAWMPMPKPYRGDA